MNKIERSDINLVEIINLLSFLFVFPVDAAWYMAEEIAGVPRIPVGFFSISILFVIIFPYCNFKYREFRIYTLLMFIFLIFSGISATASIYFDWEWLVMFVRYAGMFACGYLIAESCILKENFSIFIVVVLTLICSFVSIILLNNGINPDDGFNYLRTSNSLMISSIISIFIIKNIVLKILIYSIVLYGLVLLNSRTFLYMWISFPALVMVSMQLKPGFLSIRRLGSWVGILFLIAIILYLGFIFVLPEISVIGNPRLIPYLEFYSSSNNGELIVETTDSSINARFKFFILGFEQILNNPILGYYNGFLEYSDSGGYIHNILSYWHQFGLVPFLMVLGLILFAFCRVSRIGNFSLSVAAKVLLNAVVITALAARSYVAIELFFALGFALGMSAVATRRHRRFLEQ